MTSGTVYPTLFLKWTSVNPLLGGTKSLHNYFLTSVKGLWAVVISVVAD